MSPRKDKHEASYHYERAYQWDAVGDDGTLWLRNLAGYVATVWPEWHSTRISHWECEVVRTSDGERWHDMPPSGYLHMRQAVYYAERRLRLMGVPPDIEVAT